MLLTECEKSSGNVSAKLIEILKKLAFRPDQGLGDIIMFRATFAVAAVLVSSAALVLPAAAEGFWSGSVDKRITGDGPSKRLKANASFTVTDMGGLFEMTSRGKTLCSTAFGPAANADDMPVVGTTCGNLREFKASAEPDDAVMVSFVGGKTLVEVVMAKGFDASETGTSQMPSGAMDLRGVTLESTAADIMEQVPAVIEPRDPANPWSEEMVEGVALYQFLSPRTGALSTMQEERFLVLVAEHDPASAPYGLVRWWDPVDENEPTLAVLRDGLIAKYGEPSARYSIEETRNGPVDRGLVWSFAPDGSKLDAAQAELCTRQKPEGATQSASLYRQVWNFDASLRKVEMPVRPGCGVQLVVNYPIQPDDRAVDVASFVVFDPQRLAAGLWNVKKAKADAEIETLASKAAAENADKAKRDAVKPAL